MILSTLLQGPPPSPEAVRAALRQVFAAREYDWRRPIRAGLMGKVWNLFLRLLDWLDQLHQTHPVSYWALIGLMVVMLVAILTHFGYMLWRATRGGAGSSPTATAAAPIRDVAWHLDQARRASEAGRYADALAHRFLALVLQLERGRILKFHPSKTPAEYITELAPGAATRSAFAELVAALYRHVFGGIPCTVEAWVAFDREAEELGHRVAAA